MMMYLCSLLITLVLVTNTETALIDEIKQANDNFMKAFGAGDMDGLSALYTEDCKIMPTGAGVMTGRDAVKKVFGSVRDAGAKTVKLEIDEVGPLEGGSNNTNSTTIYERSHYKFLKDHDEVLDSGKYVVIWRKETGRWALYIDIFNTNLSL